MANPRGSQNSLIVRGKQLGRLNEKGICTGVAGTGMSAILARDLNTFDQRLLAIENIKIEQFKQTIDSLKQDRISIVKKVKEHLHQIEQKIIDEKINELINEPTIQKKLTALKNTLQELINEGKLEEENRNEEWEKRQKSILYNALLQNEIEKKLAKLSKKDRLLLEVPIFFEEIELYQSGNLYPQYFDETSKPGSQSVKAFAPLLTPKTVEETGGISLIDSFSGMYNLDSLARNLSQLSTALKNNSPIALILGNGNHSITIGYDPLLSDPWIFINANQLPTQYFSDINLLVKKIAQAFHCDNNINFFAEIYTNKSDEESLKLLLNSIKKQQSWIESQTVTDERARWKDCFGHSWLFIAAQRGQVDKVKELIAHGAQVNEKNDNGSTPLYVAAQNGHLAVALELIAHGAMVDVKTNDGATPLFIAAQRGHLDIVKELIKRGAHVSEKIKSGGTPIYVAAQNGNLDVMEELIAHGAKADEKVNGATLLYVAAQNGHLHVVKRLISYGAKADEKNNNGAAPIFIAAQNGHLEVVKELITHGAKIDEIITDGVTPIFIAAQYGHSTVVKELIAHGARVDSKISNGATPLFIAAQNGYLEVVKELIAHGARADEKTINGATPLYIAAQNGHLEVVKELIAHHAKVDEKINSGLTPLYVAAQNGHADVLQLLLNQGADPSSIFKTNIGSLIKAAEQKQVEKSIVEQFIQKKWQNRSEPTISLTLIEIATVMGHADVVNLVKLHDIRYQCHQKLTELKEEMNHFSHSSRLFANKKDQQPLSELNQKFLVLSQQIDEVYKTRELSSLSEKKQYPSDNIIQFFADTLKTLHEELKTQSVISSTKKLNK
ncbi:MAG: hypothetical protein A3F12_01375 [Gammaproteobacteria bacterium RIFCSPHIGHO2_12_FULL_38_14]|nr:MAG: hypothetical protein A3F12_01375 [Gammaproteobacteria bacterium RIFCSPHIGHO2_12_FULL_38_14]